MERRRVLKLVTAAGLTFAGVELMASEMAEAKKAPKLAGVFYRGAVVGTALDGNEASIVLVKKRVYGSVTSAVAGSARYSLSGTLKGSTATVSIYASTDASAAHPLGTIKVTLQGTTLNGSVAFGTLQGAISAPLIVADPSQMAALAGHFKGAIKLPTSRAQPLAGSAIPSGDYTGNATVSGDGSWSVTGIKDGSGNTLPGNHGFYVVEHSGRLYLEKMMGSECCPHWDVVGYLSPGTGPVVDFELDNNTIVHAERN